MAVSPAMVKVIVTAATDKRTWKVVGIIIAMILLPLILLIMMIAGMVSGVESANYELLDYSFAGTAMPDNFTDEQRGVIDNMRDWLGKLDEIISEKENDEECSLDGDMVRAAFYCLNFGGELDEDFDYGAFCECFENVEIGDIGSALQSVSEQFPQYEITENVRYSIPQVYEHLTGKEKT